MQRDTRPPMSSLLDLLPLELLPRVMLQLDLLSIRALLDASPRLAEGCILVMYDESKKSIEDQSSSFTFFVSCPSLRRVTASAYNPQTHRAHIRIFCTSFTPSLQTNATVPREVVRYFDKNNCILSYHHVFENGIPQSQRNGIATARITEHILSRYFLRMGYTFYIWPLLPEPPKALRVESKRELCEDTDDVDLTIGQQVFFKPPITRSIQTLTIDGVEDVSSICFPSILKTLTLKFSKSFKAPVVRDISFSGDEASLLIYYVDKVPLIKNLHWPPAKAMTLGRRVYSSFVLAHMPSLCSNMTEALPMHPDEGADFRYMNQLSLRFIEVGIFGKVEIIGGPNSLVENFIFTRTLSVYIKQTSPGRNPSKPLTLHSSEPLCGLKFESTLPNALFPIITPVARREGNTIDYGGNLTVVAHHGLQMKHLDQHRFCMPWPTGSTWCSSLQLFQLYVASTGDKEKRPSLDDLMKLFPHQPGYEIRYYSVEGIKRSPGVDEGAFQRRLNTDEGTCGMWSLVD